MAELAITANLAGLRKQLESIPGLTAEQARAMAGELNKSIKASERAAKAAADASKRAMDDARDAARSASDAVADVGDKFGSVGSSAGKLAGALDLVAPGLGDAARAVADIADVGEVGAAAMGSLGVAVTAITGAVGLFALSLAPIAELILDEREAAAEAAAQLERLADVTEKARAANDAFASSLGDATDELKIALGVETESEQRLRKRAEALRAQQAASMDATRAEVEAARAVVATNEAIVLSAIGHAMRGEATDADREAVAKARAENEGLYETIEQGERILANSTQATEDTIEVLRLKAEADAQVERNEKRRAAATKARAAEEQAKAKADAAAIKALVDQIAAYDAIDEAWKQSLEDAAALHQANADAINDKHVAALKGFGAELEDLVPAQPLDDLTRLEMLLADVTLAMSRAPTEELGQRYAVMANAITAQIDRVKASQSGWYAETLKISEGVAGVAQQGQELFASLGTISEYAMDRATTAYEKAVDRRKALGKDATDAEKKAAKEEVEARRNALIKAFLVDKAVKMSQAIINSALAVTSALTAGPIAGPILATAAVAAGAVQVAAIASEAPRFHAGGVVGQPDEMAATVRRGEAVLSPAGRAALGDSAINDLNAGVPLGGSGQAIQVVYGHKAFDYFVRNHLRTRMTLPKALGRGTRTGQRG